MKILTTFIFFLLLFTACDNNQCTPNCTDKVCGDDGCGGTCGTCTINEECSDEGTCEKACNLDAIKSDKTLNINLETVTVSGTVKVNGGQMPDNTTEKENYTRGYVKFSSINSGYAFEAYIGAKGAADYSKELYKGTYRVIFIGYDKSHQNAVPPYKVSLYESIVIDKDMSLDLNLETITLSGKLTLNGKSVPDNTLKDHEEVERGNIIITQDNVLERELYSIGSKGDATYSVSLFKGNYTINFVPKNSDIQNALCSTSTNLEENFNIEKDTVKDFNLETVTLKGEITINDRTMPDNTLKDHEEENRGHILFLLKDDTYVKMITLGSNGATKYELTLYKGKYNIYLLPNDYYRQNAIPAYNIEIEKDINITKSLTKNFNINTVTLSGEVTLNGKTMPDNTKEEQEDWARGSLKLTDINLRTSVYTDLGSKGKATYEITAYQGKYALFFSPQSSCYQDVLPEYELLIDKDIDLTKSQVKNINLETVKISGEVTLDGKEIPEYNEEERASIGFTQKGKYAIYSVSLGAVGPANYEALLFKGDYKISFKPDYIPYKNLTLHNSSILAENLEINSDMKQNFNAETVILKGEVTLNGKQMPDNTLEGYSQNERGMVKIFYKDLLIEQIEESIGSSGPATYEAVISKGAYDINFYTSDYSPQNAMIIGGVNVYIGCYDESETLSSKDSWALMK